MLLSLVRQASVLELVVYAAPGTNQRPPSGFSPFRRRVRLLRDINIDKGQGQDRLGVRV